MLLKGQPFLLLLPLAATSCWGLLNDYGTANESSNNHDGHVHGSTSGHYGRSDHHNGRDHGDLYLLLQQLQQLRQLRAQQALAHRVTCGGETVGLLTQSLNRNSHHISFVLVGVSKQREGKEFVLLFPRLDRVLR